MHADKQFRKELMSLAIPFALQWLLNALVGASDALMLGRLTQESIAAVSLANQVSFVLSLFIGAIVGAIGVLVAQYYGKGDFDTVRNLLSMALRYVLVLTVIFFLLAFFLPEHLMTVFTDEQDLIAIGASYLRIVSFSYLFQGASQCYLMLMKVDGRAKVSVWISAVTVAVDMTADYFLIYGAGKLLALGANGSAYSTIAVEVIALCWCVAASYQKGRIHPNSRSLRFFSPRLEKDMLRIAFPMLASSLSWGLSIVAHSVMAISEPIAPATAERLKRGMKGGNKYGKPVPGQPQPQSINRPREHGEIKDADINPLRNKRDVWKINTVPFKGGHYAAYPPKLVETCLLAGCPEGGVVLDPFMGSGTTGMVASQMGRHFVGVELNPEYTELAYKRIGGEI